mmetsp:Transcript_72081/g.172029  ORF Transcript_72081/g.172029 Transcript_72081/m.172029 type:complete len:210 (-) Transcript_72081:107-736(-)
MGQSQACMLTERNSVVPPEVIYGCQAQIDPLCEGVTDVSKCHDQVIRRTPAWRNHQLLTAARNGDVETIKALVQNGANLETRRPFCISPQAPVDGRQGRESLGMTPLMLSAQGGYLEATRILINAKADVNAEEEDGLRPLHFAAKAANYEVCKALLEADACPNIPCDSGSTPEQYALVECRTPRTKRTWQELFAEHMLHEHPDLIMDEV